MSLDAMTQLPGLAASPGDLSKTKDPAKIRDAAQQFEALLIGQILRSARENSGGWLGSGDSSCDSLSEFADQQFATMLAQQGGVGLASLISQGLERKP